MSRKARKRSRTFRRVLVGACLTSLPSGCAAPQQTTDIGSSTVREPPTIADDSVRERFEAKRNAYLASHRIEPESPPSRYPDVRLRTRYLKAYREGFLAASTYDGLSKYGGIFEPAPMSVDRRAEWDGWNHGRHDGVTIAGQFLHEAMDEDRQQLLAKIKKDLAAREP
jgi:hypothetical protein